MFWYPCSAHPDKENGHCFVFDKAKEQGDDLRIRFKAMGSSCSLGVGPDTGELSALVAMVRDLRSQDPQLQAMKDLNLTAASL